MAVPKNQSKLADSKNFPQAGEAQAHIADPAGGATVDAEARAAINAILLVLEYHGWTKES